MYRGLLKDQLSNLGGYDFRKYSSDWLASLWKIIHEDASNKTITFELHGHERLKDAAPSSLRFWRFFGVCCKDIITRRHDWEQKECNHRRKQTCLLVKNSVFTFTFGMKTLKSLPSQSKNLCNTAVIKSRANRQKVGDKLVHTCISSRQSISFYFKKRVHCWFQFYILMRLNFLFPAMRRCCYYNLKVLVPLNASLEKPIKGLTTAKVCRANNPVKTNKHPPILMVPVMLWAQLQFPHSLKCTDWWLTSLNII